MCETWLEERDWGSLNMRLSKRTSKNVIKKCQYTVRIKKKNRARGEIITRVRKRIEEINVEEVKVRDRIQAEVRGMVMENNNDL